jgi:hypothetical protein
MFRFELPILRKYPPGLRWTNRLRGTSIFITIASRPSGSLTAMRSMWAIRGGSIESLQSWLT